MRTLARLVATLSTLGLASTGLALLIASPPAESGEGGEWRRTLPPARTSDFATAYDESRRE